MVRTFKLKPWVYAGLLALSPMTADAAGLGRLTVTSALGQPLRAEIELVSVQKDELGSIAARLASVDAFREARLERSVSLLDIKFSVEQKADGAPVIRLATTQPVNEPFLDMLVELNWAAGRLLREYTVLLDPPGFSAPQAVQPVVAPTLKSATSPAPQPGVVAPSPAARAKGDAGKPVKAGKSEIEYQQGIAEAGSYGPVKKGETLTAIASQLKPEGYSLEQMLVALYQSNAQAFSGKNMHRLKTGQILRVPEEQQIASVGRAEARHELKAHTADWNAYRQKLAAAVGEAPAPKDEAPKQIAKGKITTAVEDKAAPPPAPSRDVLKVTKGEAASGKEIQSLQSKVQSLQEETTAREKSLKEANERIASLEKNIKEMQQLIELKNKNLADLQKQAEVKPEPAPAPKAEEKPAEAPAKPLEPVAAPAEAPKPEPEKPVVKPKVAPVKPKPAVEPVAEPGLMDDLTGNPLYLAGAAGALALLGGGALIAINRRRRKSLSSFEDSILTGGDLKANTVFGETAGGVVDTGDTSFLTDFSQGGLGTIDTNDVDPIAEAEVYMAYGRDAQAEEILKEAMAKDPGRHEIHLKLLEIYAARKNLIAFETLAGELYAAVGGQASPLWDKAAEMGRALDPNNPLYGAREGGAARVLPEGAAMVAPVAAAAVFGGIDLNEPTQGLMEAEAEDLSPELDFCVEEAAAEAEAEMPSETLEATEAPLEAQTPAEDEAGVLEFNLDAFTEQPAATVASAEPAPASEAEQALEFDLGDLIPPQSMAEAVEAEAEAGALEIDLDALMAPSEVAETPVEAAAEEIQDLSFELPEAEPVALVETPALPEADEESIVIGSALEAEEETHLDFNFDLESEAPGVAEEKAPPAMPELDLSGISLDLEEPAAAAGMAVTAMDEGGGAEVATKLDLARAYVEMGDKEGAKEILEEVLKEGNSQQQADANQLLASL